MKKVIFIAVAVLCALMLFPACGERTGPSSVQAALDTLRERDTVLDLGETDWTPQQLLALKKELPEGTELRFQARFGQESYSQDTESFVITGVRSGVSREDVLALVQLMPGLKRMDMSSRHELGNDVMPEICDAYPEIQFCWEITLPYSHRLHSDWTAYSTLNRAATENRMSSRSLGILKYAGNLHALDMGHNNIDDISFLYDLPELRLLILADNHIKDITPIGSLKHLQYCEVFMNYFSDLSTFSECTELLDLNVAFTKVTSLDGLDGCTKLERLWAPREQQVDPDSVARFRAKHPDCEVTFNSSGSTGFGWRQHWRYKHYVKLFKTHEWIPFEESILPHE